MKRMLAVLLCLALAVSLFAGCQPSTMFPALPGGRGEAPAAERTLTAEEIIQEATNRLEAVNSMKLDLRMNLRATLQNNGQKKSLTVNLDLPGEMTTSPLVFHSEGKLSVESVGESLDDALTFSLYLNQVNETPAIWFRSEAEGPYRRILLSGDQSETENAQTKAPSLSAVSWELETGEDSYVLRHTVTAEEAEALWSSFKREEQSGSEALTGLDMDTALRDFFRGTGLRVTVDRETLEYREITVDLSEGMKTLFAMFLERIVGTDSSLELKELRFLFSIDLHDYNSIEHIRLPQDFENLGNLTDALTGLFTGGQSDPEVGGFGNILESLDDSYSLGDYAFRLGEVTPRDIVEQGWVVTDAISMEGELAEDGTAAPGALVQLYLQPEGHETDARNPLRLGVANPGEEAAAYLDCPICFFSVNESPFYEGTEEGMVDFSGPGGVRSGMDRDQIEALLGEPYFADEEAGGMACLAYYTAHDEFLALLLNADGELKAMFYQDYSRYDPSDYVFHN